MLLRRLCAQLLFAVAALWAAAIVATPYVVAPAAHGDQRLADEHPTVAAATALVYLTGSFVCHQRPERSFVARGTQYPVCARCTGLYVGAPLGLFAMLAMRRMPARRSTWVGAAAPDAADATNARVDVDAYRRWRTILLVAIAPTLVSIGLERLGGPSDTISRALAALPLGAGAAAFVAAAVLGHFVQASARQDSRATGLRNRV